MKDGWLVVKTELNVHSYSRKMNESFLLNHVGSNPLTCVQVTAEYPFVLSNELVTCLHFP